MWIPYDSTLVLGNIIDDEKVEQLQQVAQLQQVSNSAQDSYNAQLRNKLALDMSIRELEGLKIHLEKGNDKVYEKLLEKKAEQGRELMQSMMNLVNARMEFEDSYLEMMKSREQTAIGHAPESPMKFSESTLLDLPISSDTFNMDVQYFRCEDSVQGGVSHVGQVATHTEASTSFGFGGYKAGGGSSVKTETETHMNRQVEGQMLLGTLVITCRATHKMAKVYEPQYDATKLVRAWNDKVEGEFLTLPAEADALYEEWTGSTGESGAGGADDAAKKIAVLTGTTYGSSFIGMVHFKKSSSSASSQDVRRRATNVAVQASAQLFTSSMTGSFGLDSTSASEIKSMMSSNEIHSHVTVMTHGIIPSIASQGVETCLKKFSSFDPAESNAKLAQLASKGPNTGFSGHKKEAILAGNIAGIERAKISAVLSGIHETDKSNNRVLNMNSMMLALDDYIKTTRNADGGVPVNFFVASLRKQDVLAAWFKEFRPQQYEEGMSGKTASDDDDKEETTE